MSELHKQLFAVSFNNNEIVISRNSLRICSAILEFGLYVLHPTNPCNFNIEMFRIARPISNKRQKV